MSSWKSTKLHDFRMHMPAAGKMAAWKTLERDNLQADYCMYWIIFKLDTMDIYSF